jgi:hypothetical protein
LAKNGGLTVKALSVLLSESSGRTGVLRAAMCASTERDQECGKSELNGTALDRWAFNPWFSSAATITEIEK